MSAATFAIIVATYGDDSWGELAEERAGPSALSQGPDEFLLIHDGPRSNVAHARNRGAAQARATYLVFLDGDDELAPGYLDAFREAISMLTSRMLGEKEPPWHPRPSLLVPRVQVVGEDGSESRPSFPNRQAPMEDLNHCVIGTAVPRLLFRSIGGFRPELPIYEDWALFLACKRAGARLVDVSGAIYRAYEREGSRNRGRAEETYRQIRDEHLRGGDPC